MIYIQLTSKTLGMMRSRSLFVRSRRLAFLFGCLFVAQMLLRSQVTTGNILGFATDQSGAGVPGIEITLTNVDTGYSRTLLSEEDGSYRAVLLPSGRYTIRATKPG